MSYSSKTVSYNKATIDGRTYNNTLLADITDDDFDDRIDEFQGQTKNEYVYRILLHYFTNVGKINFPLKIDNKIRCHLETEMKKLLESKKKITPTGAPDAKIIFNKAPFIQYKQFLLDKNFRQYIKTTVILKKILRMGVQKSPLQKTMKFL